jgi:hypothetical protein
MIFLTARWVSGQTQRRWLSGRDLRDQKSLCEKLAQSVNYRPKRREIQ